MKLKDLIAELKKYDPKAYVRIDRSPVGLGPIEVGSYRGYYEDLAISVAAERHADKRLSDLVAMLEGAIGTTITGYKGGEYVVHANTRVWISNYGEASGSEVTGARFESRGCVYLIWRNEDADVEEATRIHAALVSSRLQPRG